METSRQQDREVTKFKYMAGNKLLVADDSLTIQKVIRLALSNEGYEIQAVSDGNDAIQQVPLFLPDVILIDVSLPGKSAFEVKREMNQHADLEEIRFVLMSSAFEKVDESQAEEVGFHGRLTKPFDPAHLRRVLTDVLAQVTAKRMEKTSILSVPAGEKTSTKTALIKPEPSKLIPKPEVTKETPTRSIEIKSQPAVEFSDSGGFQLDTGSSDLAGSLQNAWSASETKAAQNASAEAALEKPQITSIPSTAFPGPTSTDEYTGETDIKHLTESTMRINGMDDYQWSVNEPSIKPLPGMLDQGGTSFSLKLSLGSKDDFPSPDPVEEQVPPPASEISRTVEIQEPSKVFPREQAPKPVAPPEMPPYAPETPPLNTLTRDEIETMVAKQVQVVLEKLSQNLLPEIAERLVKQEIHRLLSDI